YGTIGLSYQFIHMEFTRAFGASDIHGVGILYSVRLSRTWELGAVIGAMRVESLSLQSVAIDPVVAAITGQTSGVIAAYRINYQPQGRVQLTKSFRHGSFHAGYGRDATPGNGFYVISAQENATAGYSYTGVRHWNFGVSA